MRFEVTRRISAPRKQVYDYVMDPDTWNTWVVKTVCIADKAHKRLAEPGDQLHFCYIPIGRPNDFELTLDEITPGQYVRLRFANATLGTIIQEWFYSDAGETSTSLRILSEADRSNSSKRDLIDPPGFPEVVCQDLQTTIDNLERLFTHAASPRWV